MKKPKRLRRKTTKKRSYLDVPKDDIVFPNRDCTMRDLARFAHWAGITIDFKLDTGFRIKSR